ncbi:hypothetical protein LGM57_10735 [Burkholderia cepacia]|uniref:hypothetical protein n=1 Tax=Burkholderia cepacia TaxID=292 RepID=UPI001CF5A616|nr:hypothetical protein [Burkholderia cepacia]MCA7976796.1 hypothetical protein [Burkholderia cepacia]
MTESAEKPDWERIEAEYRAGVLSLREIAKLHPGVSHVSIKRRADKEGWTRDLAEKIQAKADDLVTKQAVTPEVTAKRAVTEREVIDANATRIAQVRGEHRADISRARSLAMKLLAEIEAQSADLELFERLGELVLESGDDEKSKLLEAYQRVLSTPSRVDFMRKFAEALKTLVGLEREAYGIKDAEKPDSGVKMVPVTDADRRL